MTPRVPLSLIVKALTDGVNVHQPHHYETGPDGKRRRMTGKRAQLHAEYQAAGQKRQAAEASHGKQSVEYSAAKTAHVDAGRRLAEHYAGVKPGEQLPLPQDHGRYFTHTADTVHVPIDKIEPIRARPDGLAGAEVAMRLAHDGIGGKRDPISLEHQGGGRYKVMDGNSTYGIAKKHGWDSIPARIWEKGAWTDPKAGEHPPTLPPHLNYQGQDSPAEMHRASGPEGTDYFTHEESSLPSSARQNTSDVTELMHDAAAHKEHIDRILDRGQGLDRLFGFHVVEGKLTHADIEEGHKKGGLVILAPLKGQGSKGPERLHQKVRDEYGGDYSKLRDISRATVAVAHPDDLPHVIHALRVAGIKLASAPKDKMSKVTDLGYRDMSISPLHNGHIGELQLLTLDMLQAKSLGLPGAENLGSGHKHYEVIREVQAKEKMTPEQARLIEHHGELSRRLYLEAQRRQDERTPGLKARLDKERAKHLGENDVQRIAKALVHSYYRKDRMHTMSASKPKECHPAFKPGYFDVNGDLVRRRTPEHNLEVWDEKKKAWRVHGNQGVIIHDAMPLTKVQAEKLAKELGVVGPF